MFKHFIQFPHPGREARPEQTSWASCSDPHVRKFLQVFGTYRCLVEGPDKSGGIGFWGEWEAGSVCTPTSGGGDKGLPTYVHRPRIPDPMRRPRRPQNTDPFVLGSRFLYTFCRQNRSKVLKSLESGSVIVFGSKVDGSFVCDTVFVVAESFRHSSRSWRATLVDQVPKAFLDATIIPMYTGMRERDLQYTLYVGATPSHAVDGMFSFVPCLPIKNNRGGFARPSLNGLRGINSKNAQGIKLNRDISSSAINNCWRAVVARVLEVGCCLGVGANLSDATKGPGVC